MWKNFYKIRNFKTEILEEFASVEKDLSISFEKRLPLNKDSKDLTTFDGPGFGPADLKTFDGPQQSYEPRESR